MVIKRSAQLLSPSEVRRDLTYDVREDDRAQVEVAGAEAAGGEDARERDQHSRVHVRVTISVRRRLRFTSNGGRMCRSHVTSEHLGRSRFSKNLNPLRRIHMSRAHLHATRRRYARDTVCTRDKVRYSIPHAFVHKRIRQSCSVAPLPSPPLSYSFSHRTGISPSRSVLIVRSPGRTESRNDVNLTSYIEQNMM